MSPPPHRRRRRRRTIPVPPSTASTPSSSRSRTPTAQRPSHLPASQSQITVPTRPIPRSQSLDFTGLQHQFAYSLSIDPDRTPRKSDPKAPFLTPPVRSDTANLRQIRRGDSRDLAQSIGTGRHSLAKLFRGSYDSNDTMSGREDQPLERRGSRSSALSSSSTTRISSRAPRPSATDSSGPSTRPPTSLDRSNRPRRSDLREQEVRQIRSESRAGLARVEVASEAEGSITETVTSRRSPSYSSFARRPSRAGSSLLDSSSRPPAASTPVSTAEQEYESRRNRSSIVARRRYASDMDSSSDATPFQSYQSNLPNTSTPPSNSLHLRDANNSGLSFSPFPQPITSVGIRAYSRAGSISGPETDWDRTAATNRLRSDAPLSSTELARIRKMSSLSAESAAPSSYKYGPARSDIFSGPSPLSPLASERSRLLHGRREMSTHPTRPDLASTGSPSAISAAYPTGIAPTMQPGQPNPSRSASVAGVTSLYRPLHGRGGSLMGNEQSIDHRRRLEPYSSSGLGNNISRSETSQRPYPPATPSGRTITASLSGHRSLSRLAASARSPLQSSTSAPTLSQRNHDDLSAPERNMLISFELFERYFGRTRGTSGSPSLSRHPSSSTSPSDALVEMSRDFVDTASALNGGIRDLAQYVIQREIEAEIRGTPEQINTLREMDAMLAQLLKYSDKQMRGMGDLLSSIIKVDKDAIKGGGGGGLTGDDGPDSPVRRAENRTGAASVNGSKEEENHARITPSTSSKSGHGHAMRKSATLGHSSASRLDRRQSQGGSVPLKLRREQRDVRSFADVSKSTPDSGDRLQSRPADAISPVALSADQSTSFEAEDNSELSPSYSYSQKRMMAGHVSQPNNHSRLQLDMARQNSAVTSSTSVSPLQHRREVALSRRGSISTIGRANGITGLSPRLPRLSNPSVDTAIAVARLDAAQIEPAGHQRRPTVDLVGNDDEVRTSSPSSFSSEAETLRHRVNSSGVDTERGHGSLSDPPSSAGENTAVPARPLKTSGRSQNDLISPDKSSPPTSATVNLKSPSLRDKHRGLNGTPPLVGPALSQPLSGGARTALKMVEKNWSERASESGS